MDPRHPEEAIDRIDKLVNQFKSIIDKINIETTSNRLGQLEREGGLVVQEICLVAPRLHEAMMQASRQRRQDLSRGVVEKSVEKSLHRADIIIADIENPYGEIAVHDAKSEEYIEKPKKKTTRKKKTAKKAEK